jgi:hypothetical protein
MMINPCAFRPLTFEDLNRRVIIIIISMGCSGRKEGTTVVIRWRKRKIDCSVLLDLVKVGRLQAR